MLLWMLYHCFRYTTLFQKYKYTEQKCFKYDSFVILNENAKKKQQKKKKSNTPTTPKYKHTKIQDFKI